MDCQSFKDQLFMYAEGSLPPETAARFGDHAAACESCSGLLVSFREVMQLIETEKTAEPVPFAGTRLLAKLEAALERQHKPRTGILRYLQPAVMALAVLVALFLGITLGLAVENRFKSNQDDPEKFQSVRNELNVPENGNNDFILFDN